MGATWFAAGAVMCGLGVLLGAFGAHSLDKLATVSADPDLKNHWDTAARYHLVHAVVVTTLGAHPNPPILAGRLFVLGIVLFSGSLYLLVGTGIRGLGAITPLGGLALIAGWTVLALGSRSKSGN